MNILQNLTMIVVMTVMAILAAIFIFLLMRRTKKDEAAGPKLRMICKALLWVLIACLAVEMVQVTNVFLKSNRKARELDRLLANTK